MKISLVVAMARDGLIGREGGLPWRLPRDLKHFRQLTWGKPIIMGRKTHETLGRALPGRVNIVLTRQAGYDAPGCVVVHDRLAALAAAEATGADEAMIIGGAEIYRQFLPLNPAIHLTLVEGDFQGDVHFPANPLNDPAWTIIHEEFWPADDLNKFNSHYVLLRKHEIVTSPCLTQPT